MSNLSQAQIDELDVDDEDDEDLDEECIHVIPMFGRRHEVSVMCWCGPQSDDEDLSIWIHNTCH